MMELLPPASFGIDSARPLLDGGSPVLLDRRGEREVVDRLVADVGAGQSHALVVRGEAGIGKTAMLEYVVDQVAGWRVVRAAGIEAEAELAFAGLHQICAPMLHGVAQLPGPQRDALSTAFGLSDGNPPDPFMLGLAVLGLFAEEARDRPLLCLIDDTQWLDRASSQVLGFVARRLRAESVAMIFAVRLSGDHAEVPELVGLPELRVTGLPDADARALLVSSYPGPVDDRVLDRIVAESQGNPLALLELPRGFTPAELAGGFGLITSAALPRRIEESFRRQITTLSPVTRQVLLVAAVEPIGDPVFVWRAVDRLGIDADRDVTSAQGAAGFVEFGSRVRFRHPLLRSAIYHAATPEERRKAHWALAQVTDPADPDRRAWHRAQAAASEDEDVADELEHRAARAQARGGPAAAAAFFERAAELTPDPAQRGQRLLAAAQANYQAGTPDAALRLLARAEASPLGPLERAHVDLLRARIASAFDRRRDTPSLLLKAAVRIQPLDARTARDTYLDAMRAAWYVADPSSDASLRVVAEAARALPATAAPPRAPDLLLAGLAAQYTEGYATAAPILRQALHAFGSPDLSGEEGLLWLLDASAISIHFLEDRVSEALASRFVQLARNYGALAMLPVALVTGIMSQIFAGDLAAAASLFEELDAVREGLPPSYAAQLLAAWQGQEDKAAELVAATSAVANRRGEGMGPIAAGWTQALLYNSLGRYEEALFAAQQAATPGQELGFLTWGSLVELITAATHSDRPELATDALNRLVEYTQATATNWALGLQARCQALVSDAEVAEPYYREAIDRLARTRIRGELARSHLYYGEWLRGRGRRNDAREQLRAAHAMFTAMGMDAFAALGAHELGTLGETVRKRSDATSSKLTAQEAQIARLVREGLSNAEIGERLFISRRTVEWHLSKIFAKLGVTSRRQLRR